MPQADFPESEQNAPSSELVDRFIPLFTAHESRIHAYILSLLPNWADAEDVLQETNSLLWKKFDKYEQGTNYFAWACRIARFEVMNYRRKKQREPIRFSEAFVEAVAEEGEAMGEELVTREKLMWGCIEKLTERDQDLIKRRYLDGATAKSVAAQVGRPAGGVYKALARIRGALQNCIEGKMQAESGAV